MFDRGEYNDFEDDLEEFAHNQDYQQLNHMAQHYRSLNINEGRAEDRSQSVYSSCGMMRPGILRLNQKFSPASVLS